MLYALFRALARTALRWFYRDVTVLGAEEVPRDGPLLVAVNHPNALVDALVAVSVLPRRVTLTAKATLWDNPLLRVLLPRVGIVPLRRAQDERSRGTDAARGEAVPARDSAGAIISAGGGPPRDRNASSFAALLDALERGGAVLLFPEGISHGGPRLAPLRTGLARVALQARDDRRVRGVRVLPVGLVFERKWQPRSGVLVQIGAPLALDAWTGDDPAELTAEVETRLRAVTLNFETARDEAETLLVSRVLAAAFEGDRPLGRATTPLSAAVGVARRVEAARARLAVSDPSEGARAAAFVARLGELRRLAVRHGVLLDDAEIETGLVPGARFTVREGVLALLGAPLALWGAVNHWLPLRLAWTLARRTSRSAEDPAMHTIVLGLALTLVAYLVQTALVAWLAGPWWAVAYLASLPPSSVVRLRWMDRARRAVRRARTYALFRREPALAEWFRAELAWLRAEALGIEAD